MRVLRPRRFVVGSGRRYIDNVEGSPHPYGFTTLATLNSAVPGTWIAMRIRPFVDEKAISFVPTAFAGYVDILVAVGTIVGAEDRIEAMGHGKARFDLIGGDRPALGGTVAGLTAAPVGPERLKKRPGQIDRLAACVVGFNNPRCIGKSIKIGQRLPASREY